MISVLKAELFRLKKSKMFWVMLCVTAGLTILSALFMLAVVGIFSEDGSALEVLGMTVSATSMLASFASFSSNSALLALICSAIFLSREFTQGTMRNAVLANKGRKQLFFAYYVMALIVGATYFVAEFALTLFLYGTMMGFGTQSAGTVATNVFIYFALGLCSVLFVQTCVTMFLFGTRKQSLTIAMPLLICVLGPEIITGLINVVFVATEFSGGKISMTTLYCLPFYNLSMLNPPEPNGLNVGMIALYDVVFSGVFFVGGFFPFLKADLK